ncbi:MAG: hypothetical protein U5J63_01245 [Fodinibius sp.]|nr:hypothetical protein [Fodinibius sp.]
MIKGMELYLKLASIQLGILKGIQTLKNYQESSRHYKKGLICESQGYGIGAFSYYRRIVEDIDDLLDEISSLLKGEELDKYQEALQKTKKTNVTQDKIELVKDLLPQILRPDNMNPLSTLHSTLSEGLPWKNR